MHKGLRIYSSSSPLLGHLNKQRESRVHVMLNVMRFVRGLAATVLCEQPRRPQQTLGPA